MLKAQHLVPQHKNTSYYNVYIRFLLTSVAYIYIYIYREREREIQGAVLTQDIKKINLSDELFVPADKTTNIYKMKADSYNRLLGNNQLTQDIKKINLSDELFVPADKTTNIYKMKADSYNRLLGNNVSAKYQKTEEQLVNNINKEAKIITRKLDLQDKVECYSRLPAFITLKDHKPNFIGNPKCRLLNPAKTQIGKISKVELDKINSTIRSCTKVNQWQSTTSVINWFQKLPLKNKSRFLKFDIVDFYPSITEDLLELQTP